MDRSLGLRVVALALVAAPASADTSIATTAPTIARALEGPLPSVQAYCAAEVRRSESAPEFIGARERDLSFRDPADREKTAKLWRCGCGPWTGLARAPGPFPAPIQDAYRLELVCHLGDDVSEHRTALALHLGDGWWVAVADNEVTDRLAVAGSFDASLIDFQRVAGLPGVAWRVWRSTSQTHGERTITSDDEDVHFIALGPSGKPSMTTAIRTVARRSEAVGRRRPRTFFSLELRASLGPDGTVRIAGMPKHVAPEDVPPLAGKKIVFP